MNDPAAQRRYVFESLRFDAATHELLLDGSAKRLRPQASLALALLLSRRGELVTKAELREALWPDSRIVLFEGSIAAVIRELRRILGDNPRTPRFIETIPKRGYRFVSPCFISPCSQTPEAEAPARIGPRRPAVGSGAPVAVRALVLAGAVLIAQGAGDRVIPPESAAGPEAPPVRVAVYPFADLSRARAHDLLSHTVARDLVGWLGPAGPERLRVLDIVGAGSNAAVQADYAIRGDIRDDGDALVVAARLLTAEGGFVWGEDYRRDPRNLRDAHLVSREVASRIAEAVLHAAIPGRQARQGVEPSSPADAAWRRGLDSLALFSPAETVQAVAAFEEATQLEPGVADYQARLAEALIRWPGVPVTRDRAERARAAAERAILLDPDTAVAQRVLGELHLFYDRDWERAGQRLERAIELSPANPSGHHSYAGWLSARGRHAEALREIELAEALDPSSVAISIDVMLMHFYARDFEGALEAARRLQQLWPENGLAHRYSVLSQLATGEVVRAAAEAREVLADSAATAEERRSVVELDDAGALDAYWNATYRAFSRHAVEEAGDPTPLATVHIQLGQPDKAVEALSLAVSEPRFSYFLPYLGVSSEFDSLCGDPRFEQLLRRLGQSAVSSEAVASRCASAIHAATTRWRSGESADRPLQ